MNKKLLKILLPLVGVTSTASIITPCIASCSDNMMPTLFNDFHHCDFHDIASGISNLQFRFNEPIKLKNAALFIRKDWHKNVIYPDSWGKDYVGKIDQQSVDGELDSDTKSIMLMSIICSDFVLPDNLAEDDFIQIPLLVTCYNSAQLGKEPYWTEEVTIKLIHQNSELTK